VLEVALEKRLAFKILAFFRFAERHFPAARRQFWKLRFYDITVKT
jgi:hypothetical protein